MAHIVKMVLFVKIKDAIFIINSIHSIFEWVQLSWNVFTPSSSSEGSWWCQIISYHTRKGFPSHSVHWCHDDVIKWKHFPRYWPFVRGIHRSPVNSPHKGQWRGALMFSLICAWTNGWANNRNAGITCNKHQCIFESGMQICYVWEKKYFDSTTELLCESEEVK